MTDPTMTPTDPTLTPTPATSTPTPATSTPTRVTRVCRKVDLMVRGVAPRCRKVDTHYLSLGECAEPLTDADRDRFTTLARAKLATFRSYDRAKVTFNYVEKDGFFVTIQIFDPRHVEVPLV